MTQPPNELSVLADRITYGACNLCGLALTHVTTVSGRQVALTGWTVKPIASSQTCSGRRVHIYDSTAAHALTCRGMQ